MTKHRDLRSEEDAAKRAEIGRKALAEAQKRAKFGDPSKGDPITATQVDNRREAIGGNNPPAIVNAIGELNLSEKYADLENETKTALEAARALPARLTDDSDNEKFATAIVKIRGTAKGLDLQREAAKSLYLAGGRTVDGFFKGMIERLEKANAILAQRQNAFLVEKRDRLRREAEARAEAEAAEAERLRARAEKAKPNTAARLVDEAAQAEVRAEEARTAAQAKPADLVRSRTAGGVVSTLVETDAVEIDDYSKLDKEKLWPFIKRDALDAAMKAWCKVNGYKEQMDGARIFKKETGRNV
jgi:hypothetical protein